MPPPSKPRTSRLHQRLGKPVEPASPSAAHFLRGASGFGAVVFREKASPITTTRVLDEGHADCLLTHATLVGWAWQDPQRKPTTRAQEGER